MNDLLKKVKLEINRKLPWVYVIETENYAANNFYIPQGFSYSNKNFLKNLDRLRENNKVAQISRIILEVYGNGKQVYCYCFNDFSEIETYE